MLIPKPIILYFRMKEQKEKDDYRQLREVNEGKHAVKFLF